MGSGDITERVAGTEVTVTENKDVKFIDGYSKSTGQVYNVQMQTHTI